MSEFAKKQPRQQKKKPEAAKPQVETAKPQIEGPQIPDLIHQAQNRSRYTV